MAGTPLETRFALLPGHDGGTMADLPDILLPAGIRSRHVEGINGLRMHVLEAGFETRRRPCLLLLHGFPELAFSWRKVMPALAAAGYHVIAPDQRGYGRTTGWDPDYDGDLNSFRFFNLVRDALGLVSAFGYRHVDAVIGHDFGSPVAAWCALLRPDVFRAVAMMSAPFGGPPPLPFDTVDAPAEAPVEDPVHRELAALPRPRKHYQWYYSTRAANADMHHAPQGLHDFLRAYYHHKSADWKGNRPYPLKSWSAGELAKLPTYYVMDLNETMPQTVAKEMPSPAEIAANQWLPDRELAFYSAEYARTGFQGGLQWYRCGTSGNFNSELQLLSGRTIDVPSCFISGRQDWGTYQRPGVVEAMQASACTNMLGCHLVDGAGHWVQQEQPAEVNRLLLDFLARAKATSGTI
jgi:pimeloyl-ACP methyl ester carboxylesterase